MESNLTSTTFRFALPGVTYGDAVAETVCRLGVEVTRAQAPRQFEAQGTGMSAAARNRTTVAPMTAIKTSVLLPFSDVVDVDAFAGIRSWSPPV